MSEKISPHIPSPDAPHETPVPLPAYRMDTTGLPKPVTDLALLGLENRTQQFLARAGIETVTELNQTQNQELRIRAGDIGPNSLAEIRRKIVAFSTELSAQQTEQFGAQPQDQREIVINAIEWFDKHELTWRGTPKTELIRRIEQYTGSLGNFLYVLYIKEKVSQAEIARRIEQASGGRITVYSTLVVELLQRFNMGPDPQRAIEARRKVGTMSLEEQDAVRAALETIPRVRMSEERLNAARLLERATAKDLRTKNPGLLTDRDWLVFEQRAQGVPRGAIAQSLGISDARVSQIETRALRKIAAALRTLGGEQSR